MAEIEAKFLIDDSAKFLRLVDTLEADELHIEPLGSQDILDRYLDTPDWQIFNAGWAYRWRDASGKRKVGLKSLATREGAIQEREEVEQTVTAFPDDGDRIPDGPVRLRLSEFDGKLRELFQVSNNRRLFNIRTDKGALVELAIDDATITAVLPPHKSAPGKLKFAEVELELKTGTHQDLQLMAERFSAQFGLLPSRMSKYERGLQTVGRSPAKAIPKVSLLLDDSPALSELRKRTLKKDDAAIDMVCCYLLRQFEAMLIAEPGAWEGLHPDGVRRMRVATRRLRAALRAFKRLLPSSTTSKVVQEFKCLTSTLGHVRDLDVQRDEFQRYLAECSPDDDDHILDYQRHLASQWQEAREDLIEYLSSQRYRQLKDDFCVYLRTGGSAERDNTQSVAEVASRLVRKRYKRLLRHGRAITKDSADEKLHALRIDGKRLRYLLEILSPVYGKRLNICVKPLRKLQDVLGAFQDACVAQDRLRCYAEIPLSTAKQSQPLTLGQLIQAQQMRAAEQRASFHVAWQQFDRKGRQKELMACLRS